MRNVRVIIGEIGYMILRVGSISVEVPWRLGGNFEDGRRTGGEERRGGEERTESQS